MKGLLQYWENSTGAKTGSICMDASSATAVATGLQCGVIDIHANTIFSVLNVWDNNTATAIDFRVDNGLSGVTRNAGILWPGYGRFFTDISIPSGQLSYYLKRDN